MFDLSGRSALVTGASGGLGLHFAQLLASRGARVVLAARRVAHLESACDFIRSSGGEATACVMDVCDADSVEEAVRSLEMRPDILVNNAGISGGGSAVELTEDDWDRVVNTNLRGAFLVATAVARRLREAGQPGAIVNIASVLGLRVAGGLSAYAASKAGLVQLTKSLALEWARYGIRVNALCPGYIETDLNQDFFATDAGRALIKRIPQRRLGKLNELDAPLLLLASDMGSYMTGSVVAVDGGHLVSGL